MKVERKDLLPLRVPLATFVAVVLVAVILIDYSGDKYAVQKQRVDAVNAQVEEASQRYRDSDIDTCRNIANCSNVASSAQRTGSAGSTGCASQINRQADSAFNTS